MDREQKKIPTILDVARLAGVSTASVSRVLNESGTCTEELQVRVIAAVKQLGYQPRPRRSKPSREGWLAVLVTDVVSPFFAQIVAGIQEQADEQGFFTAVINTSDKHSRQLRVLQKLKEQPLVGILAAGVYLEPQEWIDCYNSVKTPLVVLNTCVNHPKIACILVNFEAAAYQMTQHLLDLGHTRIAYLGDSEVEFSAAELRGVMKALGERGIEYPKEYWYSVPHTPEGASQGISRMMMLPVEKRPTAVFAFDDELAIQVLNSLRYYGLRVPQDISVVGFDNIPMAAHTYPALTTIDVPKRRVGRQMVLLLQTLQQYQGEGLGYTIVDGSLIVRSSTGPALA